MMKENMNLGKDVRIDSSCIFDKISENSHKGKFNFGDYCSVQENCRFYFSDSDFNPVNTGIANTF